MVFGLDEDVHDGNEIEKIEINCPWTIYEPSGTSHDFMVTNFRWSLPHSFWLTASIYPVYKPAHPTVLNIKRETLAFAKLFIILTVCKKYLEPHLTQYDVHVLRERMDTAEYHMGTHTSYYIQEKKKIVQNQSN